MECVFSLSALSCDIFCSKIGSGCFVLWNSAEEYFKRAVKVEPPDAEALSKYASFLWQARKDLWSAEETYLEAIAADSGNSYYAANYAHFLWSTGGEDTCFPLDNNTNKA